MIINNEISYSAFSPRYITSLRKDGSSVAILYQDQDTLAYARIRGYSVENLFIASDSLSLHRMNQRKDSDSADIALMVRTVFDSAAIVGSRFTLKEV